MDETERERQAEARLTPLQRAERDLAAAVAEFRSAQFKARDTNIFAYRAVAKIEDRIAALQNKVKALQREQRIKDLAEQIKRQRRALLDSLS